MLQVKGQGENFAGQDFDRGCRSIYSVSRRDTPLPEPRSWLVLAAWVRPRTRTLTKQLKMKEDIFSTFQPTI